MVHRAVYARALFFFETSYLPRGIYYYAAVLPRLSLELVGRWYETSYLCSGILLPRAVLPRLSLELVGWW